MHVSLCMCVLYDLPSQALGPPVLCRLAMQSIMTRTHNLCLRLCLFVVCPSWLQYPCGPSRACEHTLQTNTETGRHADRLHTTDRETTDHEMFEVSLVAMPSRTVYANIHRHADTHTRTHTHLPCCSLECAAGARTRGVQGSRYAR